MTAPAPLTLADVPGLPGRTFHGDSFVLRDEDRELFERATWLDRAYPDADPPEFPADIVEGFFSLSLLDALAAAAMPLDPATIYGFNYGLDRVRFPAQLHLGVPIVPRFEAVAVRERGPGFLLLRRCTLTAAGAPRPGVVADWWVLLLPRGDGAGSSPLA